ncbi:MAG: phosphotransferase [Erysipelotrichaceae bacterium]|nr:phosphotransferase [Erysipelotrichaceae bacterium]
MDKFVKDLLTEDVLIEVANRYNVNKENLYFVGGFENFIYGYDRDNQSYIVRISHSSHRDLADIESELDFVFYLAKNGAKVSMPIMTISNNLVEKIDAADGSYFIISAFSKADGKEPSPENYHETFFYNYGKTIGQFHKLTQMYTPSEEIKKRFAWNEDQLIIESDKYVREEDALILDRLKEVVIEICEIPTNKNNYGLIHTDVHMGNFFVGENELTVFDFDDAAYQHFVSDIAIALFYYIWFTKEADRLNKADFFMTHFMKGYRSEFKLSKNDFLNITKFLKLREIILYLVIFKTVDVENSNFAKAYIKLYRDKIINKVPFVSLDFAKYL